MCESDDRAVVDDPQVHDFQKRAGTGFGHGNLT
jgi:hypothetical protein